MEISNNSKRKIAFERKKKYLIKLSGLLHVPTINWEEQKKKLQSFPQQPHI